MEKERTLAQLSVGETASVLEVNGDGPVSKRLMEMGLVPGVSVRLVKRAPFGCPLQISLRGYHLALRRSEADEISVSR